MWAYELVFIGRNDFATADGVVYVIVVVSGVEDLGVLIHDGVDRIDGFGDSYVVDAVLAGAGIVNYRQVLDRAE